MKAGLEGVPGDSGAYGRLLVKDPIIIKPATTPMMKGFLNDQPDIRELFTCGLVCGANCHVCQKTIHP